MIFKFQAGSKFPVDLYLEQEYVQEPDNTRTSVSRNNERGRRVYYNDSPTADMLSTALVGDPNSIAQKGYAPAVGVAQRIPSILNWVMGGLTIGEAIRATNRIKEQQPIFLRTEDTSNAGETKTESKQTESQDSQTNQQQPEDDKSESKWKRILKILKEPNKGSKKPQTEKPQTQDDRNFFEKDLANVGKVYKTLGKGAVRIGTYVIGLGALPAAGWWAYKEFSDPDGKQNNSNKAENDTVQQYSTPQPSIEIPNYYKRTKDSKYIIQLE